MRGIFYGRDGLRAGWGILIFFAIVTALRFGQYFVELGVFHQTRAASAWGFAAEEPVHALIAVIATLLMTRIERRPVAEYGLAKTRRVPFAIEGAALGFVSLALLIGVLRIAGLADVHRSDESLGSVAFSGVGWLVAFVGVGVFEELLLRGYTQAALARSIGFWPAALVWSVLFGLLHLANSGENAVGIVQACLVALFFCASLRVTGSLWWVIGFHATWDWAETFFFGSADSGLTFPGHLFTTTPRGAALWSGGAAGPEGSVLAAAVLVVPALFLWRHHRRRSRAE